MREIYGRLRLEIWRAIGFEPIVDSGGGLVKMIVRAWADDSCRRLSTYHRPGTRGGDVHCIGGKEDGPELWQLALG